MLVLTQKEGEVLQIGDDIRIYIKRVKGNMVRLCIDAPREIPLVRVPASKVDRPLQRASEKGPAEGPESLLEPEDVNLPPDQAAQEAGVPSSTDEPGDASSEPTPKADDEDGEKD
ncbi:MAG: carbon storage regulator [Myxococcota bacterium]|nr:carbon storage regulator [Myxococcota bacterium]